MAQVMSERELELQSMYTASEELVEEYERDNAECHAQLEALEAERETWRLSTAQVAEESSALRRSSCALWPRPEGACAPLRCTTRATMQRCP